MHVTRVMMIFFIILQRFVDYRSNRMIYNIFSIDVLLLMSSQTKHYIISVRDKTAVTYVIRVQQYICV